MTSQLKEERNAKMIGEEILAATKRIAGTEGLEKLSMRRIAEETEYTPSILSQYFPIKEEFIGQLLQVRFKKLIGSLFSAQQKFDNFEDKLTAITRTFVESALTLPDEFEFSQLHRNYTVPVLTSFLLKNTYRENQALQLLTQCIREINQEKVLEEQEIELIAQAIAAATIGLTLTLHSEKGLGQRQKELLVCYFVEDVVIRMAKIV